MKAEYRIIIKNETDKDAKSPIAPTDQGSETPASTTPKSGGEASAEANAGTASGLTKGLVFFKKNITPFVKNGVQFQIQTVALRTGNHELQSRLQASYNIGNQVASFAESTIVSGLVGGPVGAIVGAAMSVLNTAISLTQKLEVYNLQRNIENTSIALMNVRAGGNVATTSGRR